MGNGSYTMTKSYGDDKYWTEDIMDAIKLELETHLNDVVKNNLDQLALDLFPAGYVFGDDGVATLTNQLYNKQSAESSYLADVSLGTSTDADYTDADGTNLILTFTPELAGDYLVTMTFPLQAIPTGGAQLTYDALFRISDGEASPQVTTPTRVYLLPKANDAAFVIPVTVQGIFTFTAVSQTLLLQKKNVAVTNLATHKMSSDGVYGFKATAIKI